MGLIYLNNPHDFVIYVTSFDLVEIWEKRTTFDWPKLSSKMEKKISLGAGENRVEFSTLVGLNMWQVYKCFIC